MKTFVGQYCAGKFYRYNIYKIVDSVGQIYYLAESVDNRGVTRYSETVDGLQTILESDAKALNQFHMKVR
jgi:hypothetical protein